MEYSTQWTIGYATRHSQRLQDHLDAGQDYPISAPGEKPTAPSGVFVATAYLPQSADGDNTGILIVAEASKFRAYIASPSSVAKIMKAMEYSSDGSVKMRVKIDGDQILIIGSEPEKFGFNPFRRIPPPK